jgi:ComF family protein
MAHREWAALLADLLFPRNCELCGSRLTLPECDLTCPSCAPHAEWIGAPACPRCGAELAPGGCGECRGRAFPFRGAVAAGRYAGFVRELVHRFKFGGRRDLARPLARRIAERIAAAPWGGSVGAVVPVPMRRMKILFERGYNPAELLAGRIARELGRPFRRCLAQVRATASQTSLTGEQRRTNPRGAYAARRWGAPRGRTVLLVDDVLTTGATASECARVLKDAGAEAVYLAVVGR